VPVSSSTASDFKASLRRLSEDLQRLSQTSRDNPQVILAASAALSVSAAVAQGLADEFDQLEQDLPPQDVDRLVQEIRGRRSQRVTFSELGGQVTAEVPSGADIPLQEAQALVDIRDLGEKIEEQLARIAYSLEQAAKAN
jgi:hypothetical protein